MRHKFHKIFQVKSTLSFCNFLGTTSSKMLHCHMDEMRHNIFFKSQVLQIISGLVPTLCNEAWTIGCIMFTISKWLYSKSGYSEEDIDTDQIWLVLQGKSTKETQNDRCNWTDGVVNKFSIGSEYHQINTILTWRKAPDSTILESRWKTLSLSQYKDQCNKCAIWSLILDVSLLITWDLAVCKVKLHLSCLKQISNNLRQTDSVW